ncbi:MAG TPA: FAD-binding protein [Pseudonocardiaceae bacterium]|nr:FAD-binding protein [Pseudonocardiaceae bacterium]
MSTVNWSGNHVFAAGRTLRPRTMAELRSMVRSASRCKAVGTRHSFHDIADFAGGTLIDVSEMDRPLEIGEGTVTVGAAVRYGDLARPLDAAGWALANLASLPHCTVAGSVATATHGSGQHNQNLSAAVVGLELVTADGEVRTFTRADPEFPGLVVGLGAFGVVTAVTLETVPTYRVRQSVFDHLPWDAVFDWFDEIQDAAYSVSLFTTWAEDTVRQVWLKTVADGPDQPRTDFYGAPAADSPRHPVAGMPPANCTEQLGVAGPWYDRIPHFRLEFTPSAGAELQSEFFVPRRDAVDALRAVRELADVVAPLLFVSEIRTVAGDDLWLSPAHGGDRVAIHFTWRPLDEVPRVLPVIEERLAPFGVRPHWGKLFHGDVANRYPRLRDFRALARRLDPDGRFASPFLRRTVLG